jgi:hypothetical protein
MRLPVLVVAAVLAAGTPAFAASTPAPNPGPTLPQRINVKALQPRSLFGTKPAHVEVVVEVNKLGQVARVRSIKPSHDQGLDAHCYGNALQAFIRTPDGNAISGVYRLTYDYDPKTLNIRRDVALLKVGGVNPNAKGAANQMMEIARRNRNRTPPPAITPGPAPSAPAVRRMPDLPQVMTSPSPSH